MRQRHGQKICHCQMDGHMVAIRTLQKKMLKSRKKFISSISGKRQIYNPSIGKLMYIGKNDPIPEGFRIGGKPMSDAAKQHRH